MGQLGGAQIGIERHDRHPEAIGCQPVQKEVRTIFQKQHQAHAVPCACIRQKLTDMADTGGRISIGQRARRNVIDLGGAGHDAQKVPIRPALGGQIERARDAVSLHWRHGSN